MGLKREKKLTITCDACGVSTGITTWWWATWAAIESSARQKYGWRIGKKGVFCVRCKGGKHAASSTAPSGN